MSVLQKLEVEILQRSSSIMRCAQDASWLPGWFQGNKINVPASDPAD
jgi:hypothetical protein